MARLDLSSDTHLLDVAGGTGEPALTLASCVAHVTSTDGVAQMVEASRAEAAARRLTNLAFVTAAAEALPFADEAFHVATCRLGLMFFASPEIGLSEMLRVTAHGGRICLAVWGAQRENPFFEVPLEVLRAFVDIGDPFRNGALRFDDPAVVADLLASVGGREVRVQQERFLMQAPLTFEAWWEMRVEISSTLRDCLGRLTAPQARAVREQVRARTEPWFSDGRAAIPGAVIVASASRA